MTRWPDGRITRCNLDSPECTPYGKITRGLCKLHYRRWERGTLLEMKARRALQEWPYEMKVDDSSPFEERRWFRRPTGSTEPWKEVTWTSSSQEQPQSS